MALYIGTIVSISRLGGWNHNEWIRAMIWHHEYMICLYLGYIETRHFTYFLGPKWTLWYSVYTNYETQQLANEWADNTEEIQLKHTRHSKDQLEYARLNTEYDFVKKRSLINFLTNEKLNLEQHFHERTLSMLSNIQRYEKQNLDLHVNRIASEAYASVLESVTGTQKSEFQQSSFQTALEGIRTGTMQYQGDAILPLLREEIGKRTQEFKGLSQQQESALLQLTKDQKTLIASYDRKAKVEYLTKEPKINNSGVKNHDKFKHFHNMVQQASRGDVQA